MGYLLLLQGGEGRSFRVLLGYREAATLYLDDVNGEWVLIANCVRYRTREDLPRPMERFSESFDTLGQACAFLGVAEPKLDVLFSPATVGEAITDAIRDLKGGFVLTADQEAAIGRVAIALLRPDLLPPSATNFREAA